MPDAGPRDDFPARELLTKAERWLYPGGRPSRLGRLLNRGWAIVHASGLLPRRYVTLEVPGRRTGRLRKFPLVVADYQGDRYLSLAPGPRAFIPVDRDAPLEEFHKVAPHIPVFWVGPASTGTTRTSGQ